MRFRKTLNTFLASIFLLNICIVSSHSFIFCIENNGSAKLELSVEGKCTGDITPESNHQKTALSVDSSDHCENCEDITLINNSPIFRTNFDHYSPQVIPINPFSLAVYYFAKPQNINTSFSCISISNKHLDYYLKTIIFLT